MNILILLGSPRKNGNSETLARTVVDELTQRLPAEVEYLRLEALAISPCRSCGGCAKTGMCVIKDEMIELYAKVDAADLIFLVSPVYFYGISAQSKIFIDRFQARWSRKYLQEISFRSGEKRRGYMLSTAATHGSKVFDGCTLVARSYFDAIDVEYGGALLVRGVDEKGALLQRPDEIERARQFARDIAAALQ